MTWSGNRLGRDVDKQARKIEVPNIKGDGFTLLVADDRLREWLLDISGATKLGAPDAQATDQFGVSVALSGDYAIVGATSEDGGNGDLLSDAGAACVFVYWTPPEAVAAPSELTTARISSGISQRSPASLVAAHPFRRRMPVPLSAFLHLLGSCPQSTTCSLLQSAPLRE